MDELLDIEALTDVVAVMALGFSELTSSEVESWCLRPLLSESSVPGNYYSPPPLNNCTYSTSVANIA